MDTFDEKKTRAIKSRATEPLRNVIEMGQGKNCVLQDYVRLSSRTSRNAACGLHG